MKGLRKMVARFLECHGKVMPETVEGVETALSMLHEDQFEDGVREGLDRARNSIPTDANAV